MWSPSATCLMYYLLCISRPANPLHILTDRYQSRDHTGRHLCTHRTLLRNHGQSDRVNILNKMHKIGLTSRKCVLKRLISLDYVFRMSNTRRDLKLLLYKNQELSNLKIIKYKMNDKMHDKMHIYMVLQYIQNNSLCRFQCTKRRETL